MTLLPVAVSATEALRLSNDSQPHCLSTAVRDDLHALHGQGISSEDLSQMTAIWDANEDVRAVCNGDEYFYAKESQGFVLARDYLKWLRPCMLKKTYDRFNKSEIEHWWGNLREDRLCGPGSRRPSISCPPAVFTPAFIDNTYLSDFHLVSGAIANDIPFKILMRDVSPGHEPSGMCMLQTSASFEKYMREWLNLELQMLQLAQDRWCAYDYGLPGKATVYYDTKKLKAQLIRVKKKLGVG